MPKVLLLYHYYFPDDVVSAIQFTGLAEGLASKGYDVETWPSNRPCHPSSPQSAVDSPQPRSFTTRPININGVVVKRVWRPGFDQHRFLGRILNGLWMESSWFLRALVSPAPDALVLGTDPLFAVFLVPLLKLRWPKVKAAHWAFDLFPEYAVAEGIVQEKGFLVRFLGVLLRWAYGKCDLIADLGACMRERIGKYLLPLTLPSPAGGEGKDNDFTAPSPSPDTVSDYKESNPLKGEDHNKIPRLVTLTPWALEEPSQPLPFDPQERTALFGGARLGLLYSGNLSHPHLFESTLALARKTGDQVVLAYSARGNRVQALKDSLTPSDRNVKFVPFAPLDKLEARLSAPDVHGVSLKDSYQGVAVPSKFFGALAAGRPVLFEGPEGSAISRWIREFAVGWVLSPANLDRTAEELAAFAKDEAAKKAMFQRCFDTYHKHFSKSAVIGKWDSELKNLLR